MVDVGREGAMWLQPRTRKLEVLGACGPSYLRQRWDGFSRRASGGAVAWLTSSALLNQAWWLHHGHGGKAALWVRRGRS